MGWHTMHVSAIIRIKDKVKVDHRGNRKATKKRSMSVFVHVIFRKYSFVCIQERHWRKRRKEDATTAESGQWGFISYVVTSAVFYSGTEKRQGKKMEALEFLQMTQILLMFTVYFVFILFSWSNDWKPGWMFRYHNFDSENCFLDPVFYCVDYCFLFYVSINSNNEDSACAPVPFK